MNKSRLLVVDDEPMNRDMLSRRLERAGYSVTVAPGAHEALDMLERSGTELILLDSMMPGMSGVELLKLLRGTYSPSQLPIIMVTALSDSSSVVEALNLGANDYITKPIDFSIALARIQSQLSRRRAEEALRVSEERYALAARGTNDGLWDWDTRSNRIYFSPRWKQMIGCDDHEIGDRPEDWLDRVHPEDRERLRTELTTYCQPGHDQEFSSEHRVLHKDGSYRWMLCRGQVQRGADGHPLRMAGSQTDLTDTKAYDALTGLPNRALLTERLERAIDRSRKTGGRFAVLFLDMDRFKVINDSLGHLAGDRLLVALAERLRTVVAALRARETRPGADTVARLGGDEFAILLENVDTIEAARSAAAEVLESLQKPFDLDGRQVFSSLSIGIAHGWADGQVPSDLLRDADTALYRAKALGRARCEVFDAEMRALAMARLELENDLRGALERGEFVVHYQPKVDLSSQKVAGFEALVRWNHPKNGLLLPNQFIPIAEETGLIVPLGVWVLREAARQMRRWQLRYPVSPPLEVSVNLSVRQFWQADLVEQVAAILEESGLPTGTLQLEVTESVLVEDPRKAAQILGRLKQLSVGLKLDDFGTGYSSLSYLSQLPCDSLKIDKSFVLHMCQDVSCSQIVQAVVSLARSLGKQVVAEGIETADQEVLLRSLGCGYGQGYYYARPMAVEAASAYLASQVGPLSGSPDRNSPVSAVE